MAEINRATDEPDFLDIMAHRQKEQESIYKRDIEDMKVQMMKEKLAQENMKAGTDAQHKERKLALESERNDIEKDKVKMMKKKISSNSK